MIKESHHQKSVQLILLGLILFIIGLLVGLFIQFMPNPRMALSAHLEGIMNGMFLILLGLFWERLVLSERKVALAFYLVVLYCMDIITTSRVKAKLNL